MISDATIGSNDIDRSVAFYDAVLGTLGHARFGNKLAAACRAPG